MLRHDAARPKHPEFSPFYVEFEEYFGGGNAQLDFRDMKFDWACG